MSSQKPQSSSRPNQPAKPAPAKPGTPAKPAPKK